MPSKNGRRKLSEKGLLTPENCVVAFIDLQPQMLFGVSNFDRQTIINDNVALAKATRVFDVPVVLTTVETKTFSGNIWPQIQAIFPGQQPIERSSMNSWDDKNFVKAIEETGRKKIVLTGLWTETCVALPTVQAISDGYEVYVAEDCCGDVSQLNHDNAMKRVIQAGAKPVTGLSTMLEWQRDWAARDTYDAVMDIVKQHFGAYGMGVEYAYTMVHGAPPTRYQSTPSWHLKQVNQPPRANHICDYQLSEGEHKWQQIRSSIMPRSQPMRLHHLSRQSRSQPAKSVRPEQATKSYGKSRDQRQE